MDEYVCGLMMTYDLDRFLLVNKGGMKMNEVYLNWQGPGGRIRKGHPELKENETPHEAMVREFFEETAESTKEDRWHCFFIKQYKKAKIYFFVTFLSPIELRKIVQRAELLGDRDDQVKLALWAKEFTLVDIFWEPPLFTFDLPYIINMIIYEFRSGGLFQLDPEGVNSAQKNKRNSI